MNLLLLSLVVLWCSQAILKAKASSKTDNEGLLIDSNCTNAFDCYVHDSGLALACYYSVSKCKCMNTFQSIYNLESIDNQCLMSKFGPCGSRGSVEVGCADGFVCTDDRCRDPSDAARTVKEVFEFNTGSCDSCRFSVELELDCRGWGGDVGPERCICEEQYVADRRGHLWGLRNYHGDKNCSVSQYGPCGERNGVKIDCHGDGIACVDGICINPERPTSALHEPCEETMHCNDGLICARNSYKCIEPRTTPSGQSCFEDEECVEGLSCILPPWNGPWHDSQCMDPADSFPRPPEDADY